VGAGASDLLSVFPPSLTADFADGLHPESGSKTHSYCPNLRRHQNLLSPDFAETRMDPDRDLRVASCVWCASWLDLRRIAFDFNSRNSRETSALSTFLFDGFAVKELPQ